MDKLFAKDNDTICAISTPIGSGGISVIRVSGNEALSIVRKNCLRLVDAMDSHRVYLTRFQGSSGQVLDQVLLTYFAEGKSFTGEEVVEISCHGGRFLTDSIVQELVTSGCRQAEKGEFTYRSFMNGKLDLVQAESVLDLIQSNSKKSATQALKHLGGELSNKYSGIEDLLLSTLANLEANIDFSSEDIEVASSQSLIANLIEAESSLANLKNSYQQGRVLKDGFRISIVGEPNVGKSSLLNFLSQEDRAIVSDSPGTTRDIVEADFLVNGIKVIVQDTAGLRSSEDQIEVQGIERSKKSFEDADLVLLIFDASDINTNWIEEQGLNLGNKEVLIVLNKRDKVQGKENQIKELFSKEVCFASATSIEGVQELKLKIANYLSNQGVGDENLVTSNRHFEELTRALDTVGKAKELLVNQESPEFVAFELKTALISLQRILGKEFDDQIMDRVFSEFCLGK